MNRQKVMVLFGVAWVSALVLTWFYYTNAVAPKTEKQVRVVVASRDMPLGTLLRPSDVRLVTYTERDVPKGMVFQSSDAAGRVLLVPMNTNEPVLADNSINREKGAGFSRSAPSKWTQHIPLRALGMVLAGDIAVLDPPKESA